MVRSVKKVPGKQKDIPITLHSDHKVLLTQVWYYTNDGVTLEGREGGREGSREK
jgi:hypothetical protein